MCAYVRVRVRGALRWPGNSSGAEIYISARAGVEKPILVFNEDGDLLRSWGNGDSAAGDQPASWEDSDSFASIACGNNSVAESPGNCPKPISWGSHGLSVRPTKGEGKTEIWIADFFAHTVEHYTSTGMKKGHVLGKWGKAGAVSTNATSLEFGNVADIAFGKESSVYIADGDTGFPNPTRNHRFVKVRTSGAMKPKLEWVAGNSNHSCSTSQMIYKKNLSSVHSIAYHERTDTIFVADREENRILHASAEGEILGEWGPESSLNFGKEASPWGVRTFSDGKKDLIFVAATPSPNKNNQVNGGKPWSTGNQHFYVLDASGVKSSGPGEAVIKQDEKLTKEDCVNPHLLGVNHGNGDVYLACVGGKAGGAGNKVLHFKAPAAAKKMATGNIFLLLNCLCMAAYINIQKIFIFQAKDKTMVEYKKYPTHVTAWSYMFGALAMIITAIIGFAANADLLGFGKGDLTDHFSVPEEALIPLVYAVLISSALCYGLITFANKHLSASMVTVFWPLQVPVAVLLASCPVGIFSDGNKCSGSASGPSCETITSYHLRDIITTIRTMD